MFMKFPVFSLSLLALYATKVYSVAIHSWPDLPGGNKFTSFETDVMSLPGYSPAQTYWSAIGWNNGYMGMQTWANKRVFLFSLWDNSEGNSSVVEACPACVTSHFGGEGTGVHIQYFYPWSDGVNYGFRIDYEEDGEYVIYTAKLRIEGEWMVFGKLRVINDKIHGLGYFYQFLENPASVSLSDTRVGVWSNQCYRTNGGDYCQPSLGACISYTKPVKNHSWGAGLNKDQNALWMAIDGPPGNPYDNNAKQWGCYKYDPKNLQHPNNSSSTHSASHPHPQGDSWRIFPLSDMEATCYCAPMSDSTSPVYMDQFLTAYAHQGYYWDSAARSNKSKQEFVYHGLSDSGSQSKCVTIVDVIKPLEKNQSISAMLYECFRDSESSPSYNNVPIPSECWVLANSDQVAARIQFS